VSAQVCTARARTASSQARSSNAQHRTDFKSKRAQECLGLCCLRCFCFRRDRVGTLCPPSRCAAAQVTPLLAPLSPPASSSSTHTHNTQVPLSSIYLTQPNVALLPRPRCARLASCRLSRCARLRRASSFSLFSSLLPPGPLCNSCEAGLAAPDLPQARCVRLLRRIRHPRSRCAQSILCEPCSAQFSISFCLHLLLDLSSSLL
jgi:hypothetical protein